MARLTNTNDRPCRGLSFLSVKRAIRDLTPLLLAGATIVAAQAPAPTPRTLVYGGDANFPPYEYLDETGKPAGFNVALIQFAALRADMPVSIRLFPWREVLPRLDRGEIDLVSLAHSDERAARYAFLDQTWTLEQAVLFRPGRASYPRRLDELSSETVAVEDRSLVHDLLSALPDIQRPALRLAVSQPEAVALFLDEQTTAVAGNELSLRFAAAERGDDRFVAVRVKALAYHLATRRGHERVVAPLVEGYRRLQQDGSLHRLVEEHLTIAAPLSWRRIAWVVVPAALLVLAVLVGATAWNRALQARVRRRTIELLKQRNDLERQSQLLDLAYDAIIVRALDGTVTFWNRGAEELYGWSAGEAIGRNLSALLQTVFPEPIDQIESRVSRQGRWEGELKHVARDDRTVWVRSRWALQRGPEGYPEAVMEINSDISDERDARERLRDAEARFRAVADNLLGGLLVVNEEGIIEIANPSAGQITGWRREELVGQPLAVLLPPEVTDIEQFYAAARERGMGRRTEWRLRRKDGQIIPFELSLFQFWTGGKHYIAGTFREIPSRASHQGHEEHEEH